MDQEIKRLLFIKKPFHDESFLGYLLRLTELNYFERLSWILKSCKLERAITSKTLPAVNSQDNLEVLSKLTGIDTRILSPMAYRITVFNQLCPRYSLFGSSLPSFLIVQKNSRICPKCLAEKNYIRRIWEFAPITVCLRHNCLLVDQCPSCEKPLTWNRNSVSKCLCGSDLRKITPINMPEKELHIARKIYQLCGLDLYQGEISLDNYVSDINIPTFFKILFFFASAWAGLPDTDGKTIFRECTNLELHNYLYLATSIFDDFPKNFYIFLDWAKYQQNLDKFTLKQIYRFNGKYKDRSVLGAINHSIGHCFDFYEFSFLRQAQSEYLKFEAGYSKRINFHDDPNLLRQFFIRLLTSKSISLLDRT